MLAIRLTLALLLVFAAAFTSAEPCFAQGQPIQVRPGSFADAENYNGVFLPSDRTLSRGIQRARERIAAGEFSQAIRFLDDILQRDEDSFVAAGDAGEFVGLKQTARQMIRDLPVEGRRAYETTYGPVARRHLESAVATGDFDALRQVARRYYYTPAGYEAALLFAQYEADLGRHLSAALAYEQLLETPEAVQRFDPQLSLLAATSWLALGNQQRARTLMEALLRGGHQNVRVAGRTFQLNAAKVHPIDWLLQTVGAPTVQSGTPERQWLTYRGNAARNGQANGGLPHMRVRWRARLLHPQLEAIHDDLAADLARHQQVVPPAAAPLAVGDYVITRSAHNLVAFDFRTGKRIWRAQPQRVPEFERLIATAARPNEDESDLEPARSFARRIWEDYLYNSISSDGQRVYVIRDLSLPEGNDYDAWAVPFMTGRPSDEGALTNRLCAYDLTTQGKLVWEIDGAGNDDGMKGAFFLGAPLAIGQSLYSLAEIKSAIYLAALDQRTGRLQWRQQLANLEAGILLDLPRRLQASIPSYDAGMLVCPTGAGVVVGVDLAKHSLAWAYRYESNQTSARSFRMREMRDERQLRLATRWIDSSVTIAAGHVLLTPPESDYLHCLDLVTGKLLWKLPRDERLFVAGVHHHRVLIVGKRSLTAVRLEDGKPAWQQPTLALPRDSVPTGQGFFSKGQYFLPLSSAEVVAVDVEHGTLVAHTTARDGQVLGNLVCHRGAVLSQSGRYLDRFDQIDVLRAESELQLADDPNDFNALRTLGEIAYNDGELHQAVELLVRAHDVASDDLRTREVLSECLVEALDNDFASYRQRLPLLRQLQQASAKGQLTLLRIQAEGLLEMGDPLGAFDVCLQMFEAAPLGNGEPMRIGRDHQVSIARWLRAQAAAIWANATAADRLQIAARLKPIMDQLPSEPNSDTVQQFVDHFGTLEIVEPLLMRQAKQLAKDGNLLAAQQLLLRLSKAADESLRREAVARGSLLLHEAGMHRLAAAFDEELAGPLAEKVCLDGKTGRQCLEPWADETVHDFSTATGLGWPYGKVEVTTAMSSAADTSRRARSPMWDVRLEHSDAVLGRGNVLLSARNSEVVARDSYGREFFRTPLENGGRAQMLDPGNFYGVSRGNLLVVSLGRQLVAFNTLAAGKGNSTSVLWRTNVANSLDSSYRYAGHHRVHRGGRPGSHRAPRSQWDGQWIGVIGPVSQDSCVFQDQRRLVCVDPLSGEVQWTRTDVPVGCDLFGDEQVVLAVPRSSKTALVFSTVDGRSLGKVQIPPWQEQLTTIGRHVIRWGKRADGRRELSSMNAVTGKIDWKYDFEKIARIDIAMGRYVAVVEPAGHCVILDANDGQPLVDQPVPPSPLVNEIHLFAGTDSFVLATHLSPVGNSDRSVSGLNLVDFALLDGQVHVFDRRSGRPLWNRPAEVHQQALMLTQPVDLPIIVFAANLVRRDSNGGKQGIRMLILEKASGRRLFFDDALPPSGANHCVARVVDAEQHEVAVEMASRVVRLKFTDSPRPPEPPAMYEADAASQKGPKGLFRIFQKLGSGG